MKRVLIVTYYWPPAGGPGVQRVLKFAKYLPEFGWEPVVLTVRDGEYPVRDASLESQIPSSMKVRRTLAPEPHLFYKKFTGKDTSKPLPVAVVAGRQDNWKESLAAWLRMAIFIPDAKIAWKPFAISAGKDLIRRYQPQVILSSSPPPTVHLIARSLARSFGLPWIADFRDPWTRIYHYDGVKKPFLRKWLDDYLERKVVEDCTRPLTVSSGFSKIIGAEGSSRRFQIIPNGYDFDLLEEKTRTHPTDSFIILHSGKLVDSQNPRLLWKTLSHLIEIEPNLRQKLEIRFVGKVSEGILNSIGEYGLEKFVSCPGYLPHEQIPKVLRQASLLLLVIPHTSENAGIVPGKLFEYLGALKPVLAFGPPHSDVGKILEKTRGGAIFNFDEQEITGLESFILKAWNGEVTEMDLKAVRLYHRRRLTGQLVKLLEEVALS